MRLDESWYTAAVPHLHHTLIIRINSWVAQSYPVRVHAWLVKKPHIHRGCDPSDLRISQNLFNRCILRQFSTLANVQEVILDHLDLPNFMPRILRCYIFSPLLWNHD